MNKVGEVGRVGAFIILFVGIIVSLVLFQSSATFVGQSSSEQTLTNRSFTAPAVNGTTDLVGQELLSTPIVINGSGGTVITSGNYTIAEGISTVDGLKRIRLTMRDSTTHANRPLNISYTYGMEGYIDDAGGRSVFGLVLIFGALSIAGFAIYKILDDLDILS